MSFRLFFEKENPRGLASQVVGWFVGLEEIQTIDPYQVGVPKVWNQQPLSEVDSINSRFPLLSFNDEEGDGDTKYLWGGNAIVRFLANRGAGNLFGDGSNYQHALVEQWISFVHDEITLPGISWLSITSPSTPEVSKTKESIQVFQQHLQKSLGFLNSHLTTKTFLVGERISLADIQVFFALYPLYRHAFDARFRAPFTHVNRWFLTLAHQPQFIQVIGESITMCSSVPVPSAHTTTTTTTTKATPETDKKQQQQQAGKQGGGQQGGGRSKKEKAPKEKKEKGRGRPAPAAPVLNEFFGPLPLNRSQERQGRTYTHLKDLDASKAGETIWTKARVYTTRGQGNLCFLLLRQRFYSVQAVLAKGGDVSAAFVKFAQRLSKESIVLVEGTVTQVEVPVESATQSQVELQIKRLFVESVAHTLPLLVEDAARSFAVFQQQDKEIEEIDQSIANETDEERLAVLHKKKEVARKYVEVDLSTRLDHRIIDLRTPANQAIFKIQSAVAELFRVNLLQKNFIEIHSPKIIGAASEGGAAVFKMKYFEREAYLAQSPQLYKQMAIIADFERVFEIGPVFRAEDAHTARHLTEFMGLDLEMTIIEHYHEVVDLLCELFEGIFEGLESKYEPELTAIRKQYPFEKLKYLKPTLRLTYPEGIKLLHDAGIEQEAMEDLSTPAEKALGRLVKEKYGTDFFVLEKYPESARPFYTMLNPEDSRYTNSYDFFIRGEEILSGSQRIHDASLLEQRAKAKGVPIPTIQPYIDSFKFGAPPHGGGGIGLERVVMLYLGLGNIRRSSLFPRDPNRITP